MKSRQVNKNVKNGKEFEVNTRIENNGNFAAAIGQNELTYKVTLLIKSHYQTISNTLIIQLKFHLLMGMCQILQ